MMWLYKYIAGVVVGKLFKGVNPLENFKLTDIGKATKIIGIIAIVVIVVLSATVYFLLKSVDKKSGIIAAMEVKYTNCLSVNENNLNTIFDMRDSHAQDLLLLEEEREFTDKERDALQGKIGDLEDLKSRVSSTPDQCTVEEVAQDIVPLPMDANEVDQYFKLCTVPVSIVSSFRFADSKWAYLPSQSLVP